MRKSIDLPIESSNEIHFERKALEDVGTGPFSQTGSRWMLLWESWWIPSFSSESWIHQSIHLLFHPSRWIVRWIVQTSIEFDPWGTKYDIATLFNGC